MYPLSHCANLLGIKNITTIVRKNLVYLAPAQRQVIAGLCAISRGYAHGVVQAYLADAVAVPGQARCPTSRQMLAPCLIVLWANSIADPPPGTVAESVGKGYVSSSFARPPTTIIS